MWGIIGDLETISPVNFLLYVQSLTEMVVDLVMMSIGALVDK